LINKKILNYEIKNFKKTRQWSQILIVYLTEIIEVCVSQVGWDLPRDDAIQSVWVFVMKILPKCNTRKNSYCYLQTSIRHYIYEIRHSIIRQKHVDLSKVPEPVWIDKGYEIE
jgi:hypothetical protein